MMAERKRKAATALVLIDDLKDNAEFDDYSKRGKTRSRMRKRTQREY